MSDTLSTEALGTDPPIVEPVEPVEFQVDPRALHHLLAPVVPFASTDTTLPVLCHVLVERRGSYLTAWATDRYRAVMHRQYVHPDHAVPEQLSVMLDAKALRRLLPKLLKARHGTWSASWQADRLDLHGPVEAEDLLDLPAFEASMWEYPRIGKLIADVHRAAPRPPRVASLDAGFFGDFAVISRQELQPLEVWAVQALRDDTNSNWAVRCGPDFFGVQMGIRLPGSVTHGLADDVAELLDDQRWTRS